MSDIKINGSKNSNVGFDVTVEARKSDYQLTSWNIKKSRVDGTTVIELYSNDKPDKIIIKKEDSVTDGSSRMIVYSKSHNEHTTIFSNSLNGIRVGTTYSHRKIGPYAGYFHTGQFKKKVHPDKKYVKYEIDNTLKIFSSRSILNDRHDIDLLFGPTVIGKVGKYAVGMHVYDKDYNALLRKPTKEEDEGLLDSINPKVDAYFDIKTNNLVLLQHNDCTEHKNYRYSIQNTGVKLHYDIGGIFNITGTNSSYRIDKEVWEGHKMHHNKESHYVSILPLDNDETADMREQIRNVIRNGGVDRFFKAAEISYEDVENYKTSSHCVSIDSSVFIIVDLSTINNDVRSTFIFRLDKSTDQLNNDCCYYSQVFRLKNVLEYWISDVFDSKESLEYKDDHFEKKSNVPRRNSACSETSSYYPKDGTINSTLEYSDRYYTNVVDTIDGILNDGANSYTVISDIADLREEPTKYVSKMIYDYIIDITNHIDNDINTCQMVFDVDNDNESYFDQISVILDPGNLEKWIKYLNRYNVEKRTLYSSFDNLYRFAIDTVKDLKEDE